VIDLKVVTPQMILNYASYLEEHHYFDDSFRVYEKAVTMFVYPQLRIIWLTYIDKFIARYGATKIERLRDMFENALSSVTQEYAPEFYIKYGKAEEELGLTRQAIAVYERATRAVGDKDRLNMYRLYARKTEQFYGVTKSRPVYERAIMELNENDSRVLCVEFAEMETRLGEVCIALLCYIRRFMTFHDVD
jgi:pre-mRNA-splicing factor SYF1